MNKISLSKWCTYGYLAVRDAKELLMNGETYKDHRGVIYKDWDTFTDDIIKQVVQEVKDGAVEKDISFIEAFKKVGVV